MSLGEFELIRRYFTRPPRRPDTLLTVGDDCALLVPRPSERLAVTTDTLVAGVHFLPGTDPRRLGHKCLAVNLSDLAAMGAAPAWVTLALTLPEPDEAWLQDFASGFLDLAARYGVDLIGGDTTRGPLSVTVQAMGWVAPEKALHRSGARAGDAVYMTGELGLAGLGLRIALGKYGLNVPVALERLDKPEPRIAAGLGIAGLAHACIDISDGLTADLGHILAASEVGATLDYAALPLPEPVRRYVEQTGDWNMPLNAGDDYELCFTIAPQKESELLQMGLDCTRIGQVDAEPGLRLLRDGICGEFTATGYRHF